MGPIPKGFTLERFIGQQLQEVGVGSFVFQLRFEGRDVISCEGCVTMQNEGEEQEIFGEDWGDLNLLKRLLGKSVSSWAVESSHCFSISFSEGSILRFYSKDHPYEDFVIYPELLVI